MYLFIYFPFHLPFIFAFVREEGGGSDHGSKPGSDLCAKMRVHRCVVLVNGAI